MDINLGDYLVPSGYLVILILVMLLEIQQSMMGFNAACTASALWHWTLRQIQNFSLRSTHTLGRVAFSHEIKLILYYDKLWLQLTFYSYTLYSSLYQKLVEMELTVLLRSEQRRLI